MNREDVGQDREIGELAPAQVTPEEGGDGQPPRGAQQRPQTAQGPSLIVQQVDRRRQAPQVECGGAPGAKLVLNEARSCRPWKISRGGCAYYEVDFLGFSYGFRPRRNPHMALSALHTALMSQRVNWVLDADIRSFLERTA